MRKEAEMHAAEDNAQKELIETKNQLDNAVYSIEKQLKDAGDKVPAASKSKIDAALKTAKDVLAKSNATKEELKAQIDALTALLQAEAQNLYPQGAGAQQAQQAQQGQAQQQQQSSSNKQGPVDADFEVVDDDKKDNK